MIQTDDEKSLVEVADRAYKAVGELIQEGNPPFAVAAVYIMIALQIYKSSLSEEDYNEMVNSISLNRDNIKTLAEMSKNVDLQKFH